MNNPVDAALLGHAERDAAAGRIDSAGEALRLAGALDATAPLPAISPQLAGIRDRLIRDEQGASESLRELMLQLHGPVTGQEIYDAAMKDRAHAARVSELSADLIEVRAFYSTLIEENSESLISLQQEVDLARVLWVSACGDLERQRIYRQQLKAQLQLQTREIISQMKRPGPALAEPITQWQVPAWHQQTQLGKNDDRRAPVDVAREPQ